jgi:hypothetical protein
VEKLVNTYLTVKDELELLAGRNAHQTYLEREAVSFE